MTRLLGYPSGKTLRCGKDHLGLNGYKGGAGIKAKVRVFEEGTDLLP